LFKDMLPLEGEFFARIFDLAVDSMILDLKDNEILLKENRLRV